MVLEDYLRRLGDYTVNDIISLVQVIHTHKNTPRSNTYKKAVKTLLSYYTFTYDGKDDVTVVSMQVQQDLFLEHITVTEDHIIALAKIGVIVFPEHV